MLVTRPEPDASDSAARLRALGIDPVTAPFLQMSVLPTGLPDAKGLAAIALTSSNAIRALDMRGALRRYLGVPAFAVGDRTAAAARQAGFVAVVSASGDFQALVSLLETAGLKGPVFYPVAQHQSGDLARALAPHGLMVIRARVYQMLPVAAFPEAAIPPYAAGTIKAALLYSRRTAELYCSLTALPDLMRARPAVTALCLSENVAGPLLAHKLTRIALADHPSEEAMMALALSFSRGQLRT